MTGAASGDGNDRPVFAAHLLSAAGILTNLTQATRGTCGEELRELINTMRPKLVVSCDVMTQSVHGTLLRPRCGPSFH